MIGDFMLYSYIVYLVINLVACFFIVEGIKEFLAAFLVMALLPLIIYVFSYLLLFIIAYIMIDHAIHTRTL